MKRILLFGALLLAFVVWTFPHRLLVERLLANRLAELGVQVGIADVTPAWPPGYRLTQLDLQRGPYSMHVDELWLDLFTSGGLRFDADACGGTVRGSLYMEPSTSDPRAAKHAGKRIEVYFDQLDPSVCMHLGSVELGGTYAGELRLDGLGHGAQSPFGRLSSEGHLAVEAHDGSIGGYLPGSAAVGDGDTDAPGLPIGEWAFARASADARIAGADIVVDKADAQAEGVEWHLDKARLAASGSGTVRISGDFRARRLDDSGRSKAIVSLLPKAGEDDQGWRHYRIAGSLAAPRILGLK